MQTDLTLTSATLNNALKSDFNLTFETLFVNNVDDDFNSEPEELEQGDFVLTTETYSWDIDLKAFTTTTTEVFSATSLSPGRFRFNLQDNVTFNYFIIIDVFYIDIEIRDLDKDITLQMVFKAVNDFVRPDRFVLTLLVYSAYSCMSELDTSALTVSQRVTAIKKAMEEISKIRAKRQVQNMINMHNGPDAYVQSTTLLNRDFYVWPPPELIEQLGLREGSILRVVKPLYGVPEAGNHWFQTYHFYHVEALAMKPSTYDPCLLYSTEPFGVVGLQTDDTFQEDVKSLNKRLQWQIQNAARGIQFVKLDKETLQLLVFTDASFANNKDLSSQIGYIVALADRKGNVNTLHWTSVKCKRVIRSVLASELYGMAYGFDMGAAIKSTIEGILEIDFPLVICTDSRSLYDCLVKLGTTQEKWLMIDVMCLRQAYERRQIAEVRWIEGTTNPADSMTKGKPSSALKQLLDMNKVQLEVVEWVERDSVGGGTENRTEEGFGAIPN
ncbi:hypothetical protein B7463_g8735, partial [Scytalidium lignicola]